MTYSHFLHQITLFSEIYLDGNQLGCQGAYELIKLLLLDCERFIIEKQDKVRIENELKAQEGKFNPQHFNFIFRVALLREQQGLPAELTAEEKKKKKKKSNIRRDFSVS